VRQVRFLAESLDQVRLQEPVLRVVGEPRREAVGTRERLRDEVERLLQPIVRLGTAQAQEPGARLAEALAAQAGDAERVVGAL
jgi:hypothetical protein